MALMKPGIQVIERPAEWPIIVAAASRTESRLDAFLRAHADRIVLALSVLAAFRILIFAAAFPLTNNTDERFHWLTTQMYAQGRMPGKDLPRMEPEFARTFLLYWSPEYGRSQEYLRSNGVNGPLYGLSPQVRDSVLAQEFYVRQLSQWLRRPNYEAQSAPFYYTVAAGWYDLGAILGLRDWVLGYWVRVLNPIAYALLVWLSYRFVRRVYPERTFLHLAVPALIAVFPQDVFFGMNRDVFSAPLAAAALLLMTRAVDSKTGRCWPLLIGSFLVSLAFLSNVSNCVLYGPLIATIWVWVHLSVETVHRKVWIVSANALAAAVLPSLWMLRNYLVMGDLTGGRAKAHDLAWTVKPFAEMFHHPLFSLHGLRYFLVELTRRFWDGEYVWHGLPMRSAWADRFYILSSAVFLVLFAIDFVSRRRAISPLQRLAGFQALFLVVSSVLFLAAISLPFDFHDCAYPSRLYPYFVSGRIISGALLPFILIYASSLELITSVVRKWVSPAVVIACLLLFITGSEIRVRSAVFASPYNFFALSGWRH
jgi:hypothetical protein